MTTIETLKAISTYGVNAVLVIAVVWMSGRVSDVEEKLYDCFQLRIEEKGRFDFSNNLKTSNFIPIRKVAVLPDELKVVRG